MQSLWRGGHPSLLIVMLVWTQRARWNFDLCLIPLQILSCLSSHNSDKEKRFSLFNRKSHQTSWIRSKSMKQQRAVLSYLQWFNLYFNLLCFPVKAGEGNGRCILHYTMTLLSAFCSLCAFLLHTFSFLPLLALSLAAFRLFFFLQQSMLSGSEHWHLLHRYAAPVQTADPSLWGHEFQCFYPPPSLANMPAFSIYTPAFETRGKPLKRKSIKGYKHAWA